MEMIKAREHPLLGNLIAFGILCSSLLLQIFQFSFSTAEIFFIRGIGPGDVCFTSYFQLVEAQASGRKRPWN